MRVLPLALVALCLLLCVSLPASAHSQYHHGKEAPNAMTCAGDEPPTIWSYHAHVMFLGNNANETAQSLNLMKRFEQRFKPNGTCEWLTVDDRGLCMFEPEFETDGPFPTAQWAVFIPVDRLTEVLMWLSQRRGLEGMIDRAGKPGVPRQDLSVLIHPNTGCQYSDHGKWHMWMGQPWQVDLSAMSHPDIPFDVKPPYY